MKDNRLQIRLTEEEKKEIMFASKMSDIKMSKIIRDGALKEAKRILRQLEK